LIATFDSLTNIRQTLFESEFLPTKLLALRAAFHVRSTDRIVLTTDLHIATGAIRSASIDLVAELVKTQETIGLLEVH
jgi:hypothetical protein